MTRIVGVHGVGNHLPDLDPAGAGAQLASAWKQALAKRQGTTVEVHVAYYAHLLNTEAAQGLSDDGDPTAPSLDAALAWARALGAPPEIAQGRLTRPVRQIAEWMATRYGLDSKLVRWFVATFLAEVEAYLGEREGAARHEARLIVAQAVERQCPDIVIAHSLGSVVAYEALCTLPAGTVGLFVTIGSPLAMPDVVYDRVETAGAQPAPRPAAVERWINVADVGDLVAVPSRLAGRFDVDADLSETIGVFDFHRARKYLESRTVAAMIAAAR
ncbi:hypothetical protein KGA66_00515 [Actinocrinis puniceicyclus]|uniref:Serine peptidase n=1 Tax=Actinocrinis puniceicyclus TaxID=977794 RepID=A0A8J8B967_9ACTN|nr:hypothetical protein [Actinocrinis puniceicyclus]MBS2961507.1 hypothetical protein [Actinocrinis puniceicyclus]